MTYTYNLLWWLIILTFLDIHCLQKVHMEIIIEFLLYYRSFTTKLMWFGYMETTKAFASGLYTVLAPRLLWLAITICLILILLPIFTNLLGKWPIWKLKVRLGKTFNSKLLDMVWLHVIVLVVQLLSFLHLNKQYAKICFRILIMSEVTLRP